MQLVIKRTETIFLELRDSEELSYFEFCSGLFM